MPERRRKVTPELNDEAVKMVIETSRPVRSPRWLGGSPRQRGTLGNWVNKYRVEHAEDEPPLTMSERGPGCRNWGREARELRMKTEFLGRAAAFFAQEYR